MYLMYTLNENGDRVYTLKVILIEKLKKFSEILERQRLSHLWYFKKIQWIENVEIRFEMNNFKRNTEIQWTKTKPWIFLIFSITETNRRRLSNHIGSSR